MQVDAISPGQTVIVVDDLLGIHFLILFFNVQREWNGFKQVQSYWKRIATGGSAKAAGDLVKLRNGTVLEYMFIIELSALKGKDVLDADTYSMIQFEDWNHLFRFQGMG